MVALPSDVARSGPDAKKAFERVFKAMVSTLERGLRDTSQSPHTTASAIAALCVGGMVTARAVNDDAFANQMLKASMAVALKFGGWENNSKSKSNGSRHRTTGAKRLVWSSAHFCKSFLPRAAHP
jgi:hypothetical protein